MRPHLWLVLLLLLLRGEGSEGFHPHSPAASASSSAPAGAATAATSCATVSNKNSDRQLPIRLAAPGRSWCRAGHGSVPARRGVLLCRGGGGDLLLSTASNNPTTMPPPRRRRGRPDSPWSSSTKRASTLRALQGGGGELEPPSDASLVPAAEAAAATAVRRFVTLSLGATLSCLALYAVYQNRELLLDKERVQEETLKLLHRLNDGTGHPGRSLALYSVGMALWEMCSLSTIPVETAAGMVFGWKAAPFSVLGKLMGAGTAFALGRTWLNKWATERLAHNSVWKLVTTSRRFSPWSTAFLMKYSCFPEFVKNFGSSFLTVSPFQFAVATLIHGGSFTLLWTWWGVETALKLQSPAGHAASAGLKVALVVAGFVGVVATPALMTWWINALRQEAVARKA